MPKDDLPPRPIKLVTTQEEVSKCRDIVRGLPADALDPKEREYFLSALDRLGVALRIIKIGRSPIRHLKALFLGDGTAKAKMKDASAVRPAQEDTNVSQ